MKSYLKFLSRNRLYTIIEVLGLTVALAFVIVFFQYAWQEYNVPKDKSDYKDLYAIGFKDYVGMTYGTGDAVKAKIPEIVDFTRLRSEKKIVGAVDDYFNVLTFSVDPNFFKLCSIPLKEGGMDCLGNPNGAVVTEKFARMVFGKEDPMGKELDIQVDSQKVMLTVTGVAKDFEAGLFAPAQVIVSIRNPILFSPEVVDNPMDHFGEYQTIVKLAAGTDPDVFKDKLLNAYKQLWDWWGKEDDMMTGVVAEPMADLYFFDYGESTNWLGDDWPYRIGNRKQVNILLLVGIILLFCAVFNYINLSTAETELRAKEMATRRLLGESQKGIIGRLIGEAFIFTAACFALGWLLSIPLRRLVEGILGTEINTVPGVALILVYALLVVLISLVSGLLPAYYVSRYKPIDIVKGNLRFRNKMVFSKIFIGLQNAASVILIALALAMIFQMNYLKSRPRGYDYKDIVRVEVPFSISGHTATSVTNMLQDGVKTMPFIKRTGRCAGGDPMMAGANGQPDINGKLVFLRSIRVDSAAFSMFGFKVAKKFSDPLPHTGFLSESGVRLLGLTDATLDTASFLRFKPCGIVDDFVYGTSIFSSKMTESNAVFIAGEDIPWTNVLIAETSGSHSANVRTLHNYCDSAVKAFTGKPYEIKIEYYEDMLLDDLKSTKQTMRLLDVFMVLSILLSALGLFAMCTYFTNQNAKSMALCKVFGASVNETAARYSKMFMWIAAVSAVVASPIAYYVISRYLTTFPYRIGSGLWILCCIVAVVISLVVAFISVWGQTLHAAKTNPVIYLRKE